MDITDEEIRQCGYQYFINYGDFFLAVLPMTYGKGRLIYSENIDYVANAWCYERYDDALFWLGAWNPKHTKEPGGWIRNPFDGRRRPGGDPNKEYIRR